MVAFRHPSLFSSSLLVFILTLESWRPALAQMGLRTLPLTASRNRTNNLGLFSKWTDGAPSNPSSNNAPSIEIEIAAILRDIAYGVSTEPTTTTSTSTTTQKPTTEVLYDNSYDSPVVQPPSSIPVSPPWDDVWKSEEIEKTNNLNPMENEYVEPPVVDPSDDFVGEEEKENNVFTEPEDTGSSVIRSDVGVHEVPWLSSIGVMWEVHVYTTAGLFSLIVFLSLYCLTRVHLLSHLLPRGYYITVHLLVFLAAFFRCVYFFHDPYAAAELLPSGLSNILFNTGTPCIITALAVLIIALLRAARLIILPLNLQSPVVVAVISGALVAGSVIIDTFGGFLKDKQIAPGLKGVMQALTAGWGAALCIGYSIVFIRIERAARRQQNEIVRLTFSRLHMEGSSLPRRFPKSSLKYGARFTLIACISGLLLAALQVYGLINCKVVANLPPTEPWVWLVYQTSCRILEITMWTCICIASAMPANIAKQDRNKTSLDDGQILTAFSCESCSSCTNFSSCCIYPKNTSDDMYSTICQTNHVARNFSIHSDGKLIPQDTIASTGLPPKHISTTLLPPKVRKSLNKASTLHSTSSDAQLLWNNNSNANSSNSSSRPSSLILTEGGLIKFRTHDPHSETVRIINYPKKEYDPKLEMHETQKKILEHCTNATEDNYINSGALTPEEKRIIEKSLQSAKMDLLQNDGTVGLYADVQENIPYNKAVKLYRNEYSPIHQPYNNYSNNCSSINAGNSFDVHFYEDCENGFYQSPSLDSSMESGGHIYASIQQPVKQGNHMQQIRILEENNYQGKILNNSNFDFPNPVHSRRPSSSNHSHQDIIQTDYLTDASQDHIESPHSDPRVMYQGSHKYLQQNDSFHQSKNEESPSHGYRYYVPKSPYEDQGSSKTPMSGNVYAQQCFNAFMSHTNNESKEIVPVSPISPSQRKKYSNKQGTSNFENVSYSPLQGEDEQYPQNSEGRIRPCGHRPRKTKLSPVSSDNLEPFNDEQSYRQTLIDAQNTMEESRETAQKEIENNQINLFPTDKEKQYGEPKPDEMNPQIDFSPLNAHKFHSEGIPWTDLRTSQEAPSESISPESSLEGSNFDIHSKANDDLTEKSMEVRWPSKGIEGSGV